MGDDSDSSNPFRSVSDALGQFVRRVSTVVSEVSESVTLPETLRRDLDEMRSLRFAGEYERAHELADEMLDAHPHQPHAMSSLAYLAIHELLIAGRKVESPRLLAILESDEGEEGRKSTRPPGVVLLEAAVVLGDSLHPTTSAASYSPLDSLRRASRAQERLATFEVGEFQLLEHLLAGRAHEAAGAFERAVREYQKGRSKLPLETSTPLREWMLEHGTATLLAEGRVVDAERWVRGLHRLRIDQARAADAREARASEAEAEENHDGDHDTEASDEARPNHEDAVMDDHLLDSERAWMSRIMAARGERGTARALLEALPEEPRWESTRLRVAIATNDADTARGLALRYLQQGPEEPGRLRLWALAELLDRDRALEASARTSIVEALLRAHDESPPALRSAHLRELALVVLEVGQLSGAAVRRIIEALEDGGTTSNVESRLVRARSRMVTGEAAARVDEDFLPGPPRRFRGDPGLSTLAIGPDELSPLRDPKRRHVRVTAQMRVAEAERALLGQPSAFDRETAEAALVEALMEDPGLGVARSMMAALAQPDPTPTLETLLSASTHLLARIPGQVLGVSLEGVASALSQVVAARERLARPLTIAIMGEFSSGKSTFVNALLGQTVAPMGVLPTTSTINVFRRGTGRGARVHYRDGRISTVSGEDLERYLEGLDDQEANKIRYLEIDRVEGRMGNAAVVDTPGLNALDPYHEKVAREFLDEADAVVWIFSATRGGTASEAGMLDELREGGRQVLGILNKVDTLDESERKELGDYLRGKLGEVLVDVIPLSATQALAHRTSSGKPKGSDPFVPVDKALETHFLQRARQLKTELTRRRLHEALLAARTSVDEAARALDSRAQALDFDKALSDELAALGRFADLLESGILDLDDALTRECLALGVVVSGSGRRHDADHQDFEYLDSLIEEMMVDALQRAMNELGGQHDAVLERIDRHLLPWVRGYMRARAATGLGERLIRAHGDAAKEGEAAFRHALRRGLRPLADDWAREARSLSQGLELALVRARRQATSAPQAQALRLHTTWLAGLDQLIERAAGG